jgi:hypothetical protein
MRKLISCLLSIQFAFFQMIDSAACPPALEPLPKLPLPAAVPPPVSTCSTQHIPSIPAGFMPITFTNNTGLPADEVYIVVLVNSSTQYLSFDSSSKATLSSFVANTYLSEPYVPSGSSQTYSYTLDSFSQIDSATYPLNYTFYIPDTGHDGDPNSNFMKSSRILVSLKRPITYFIDYNGDIQAPSEFDITNDNYYTLNDKIEFDLGSNNLNRLNLNLTGVDFFGLPMLIQANYKFFFGSTYTPYCAVTGMPSGVSLSDVFTQYGTALSSLVTPFDAHWRKLVATYINPPSTSDSCTLRIYAPATAMGSTQKQLNPSPISFPEDYFLTTAIPSDPECTWFNKVWYNTSGSAYYQQTTPHTPYLVLDATTTNGPGKATGYETNNQNFTFTIAAPNSNHDHGKSVIIPFPTSTKAFFTGAVSDYTPAISGTASTKAFAQVFKVFATSIIAGFFPINCQFPTPIEITSTYMQDNVKDYFENNALLQAALSSCSCVENSPWFDFYSRTLLTIGTPNLFYTSAYSDFLGADGTIVIVDLDTENVGATIYVTLNDCSTGINFPDPYTDSTDYTVYINAPEDADQTPLATIEYSLTAEAGPFIPYSVPLTNASGSSIFVKITYKESNTYKSPYDGLSFVSQVSPNAKIFFPILPGQGTITTNGTTTTVAIGAPPKSN